jgi:hypothetical protein
MFWTSVCLSHVASCQSRSLTLPEKLSSIVRSVSVADHSGRETPRERDRGDRERDRGDKETISTTQQDPYGNRASARSRQGSRTSSLNRGESRTGSRSEMGESATRHESGHWRNNSNVSGGDYVDQPPPPNAPPPVARRHEYDYHSMENEPNTRNSVSNPIPPPTLTVKSEFPTLSRSKVQQSLTCLITLDVTGGKWQNYAEDLPAVPSAPTPTPYDQQYPPPSPSGRSSQYSFERSDARSRERELEAEREQQDLLASITEELRNRVENWHGLDFNRYSPA